jgi:hypothetical protein
LALVILRFALLRDQPESSQVLDEIRWGLAVVGAFFVLITGSFFVQLAAALPQLQIEAVQAGISADRASRLHAAVRAIDHRLMEGVRLREALDRRSSVDTFGEGWVQTLTLWQRRCRRTVRHCAPDQYPVFQANVGSDARFARGLSVSHLPSGQKAAAAKDVIQQWLHALGGVRDAL